jgi:4-hydroxy-3-methylbut-2-enyl diphosphate reductase
VTTVGLTAGASAPEVLVQEVLAAMGARFAVTSESITTAVEDVVFKLPRALTAS